MRRRPSVSILISLGVALAASTSFAQPKPAPDEDPYSDAAFERRQKRVRDGAALEALRRSELPKLRQTIKGAQYGLEVFYGRLRSHRATIEAAEHHLSRLSALESDDQRVVYATRNLRDAKEAFYVFRLANSYPIDSLKQAQEAYNDALLREDALLRRLGMRGEYKDLLSYMEGRWYSTEGTAPQPPPILETVTIESPPTGQKGVPTKAAERSPYYSGWSQPKTAAEYKLVDDASKQLMALRLERTRIEGVIVSSRRALLTAHERHKEFLERYELTTRYVMPIARTVIGVANKFWKNGLNPVKWGVDGAEAVADLVMWLLDQDWWKNSKDTYGWKDPRFSQSLQNEIFKHAGNPVPYDDKDAAAMSAVLEAAMAGRPLPEGSGAVNDAYMQKYVVDYATKKLPTNLNNARKLADRVAKPKDLLTAYLKEAINKKSPDAITSDYSSYKELVDKAVESGEFSKLVVERLGPTIKSWAKSAGKDWLAKVVLSELDRAVRQGWFIKAGWVEIDWLVARKRYHLAHAQARIADLEIAKAEKRLRDLRATSDASEGIGVPRRAKRSWQLEPLDHGTYQVNFLFSSAVTVNSVRLMGKGVRPRLLTELPSERLMGLGGDWHTFEMLIEPGDAKQPTRWFEVDAVWQTELPMDPKKRAAMPLDGDPSVVARFNSHHEGATPIRYYDYWDGYAWTKRDTNHKIQLFEPKGTSVLLLLDTSKSMNQGGKIEASARAAIEFVESAMADDPKLEFALWTFATTSEERVPFGDGASVIAELEKLAKSTASGDTSLSRGIRSAGRALLKNARYRKRTLLVFTDGQNTDTGSVAAALRDVRNLAPRTNATLSYRKAAGGVR